MVGPAAGVLKMHTRSLGAGGGCGPMRDVTSAAPPALISIHYIRYYAQRPLVAFCDVFDDTPVRGHHNVVHTSILFLPCDGSVRFCSVFN